MFIRLPIKNCQIDWVKLVNLKNFGKKVSNVNKPAIFLHKSREIKTYTSKKKIKRFLR
jgi:hypothetical protein